MKTILVVEDNSDLRALMRRIVIRGGASCEMAVNGEDASHRLQDGLRPALIFLDLGMPVMDGYDFLTWKSSQPDLQDIPVVVVSAEGLCKPNGADSFVRKPFTTEQLVEKMNAYL